MTLNRTRVLSFVLTSFTFFGLFVLAQDAGRQLGSIKSISGNTVILKTDSGAEETFQVSDNTRIIQTEPGQKDLSSATAIKVQDLQIGDRLLVRGKPGSDGKTLAATSVIAMKQTAIASKQQQDLQDWQRRGVGGLVKTVSPAEGTVTISTVSAAGPKDLAIKTTKSTIVRRYSSDSVKFDDAKAASITDIKPGDQLRARGQKNAEGSELSAEEMIGGSFRNVSGLITSVDANGQTVTVNDLTTKKPITIRLIPDSQIKKLPAMMAQMIAARLKGGPSVSAPPTAGDANGARPNPAAAGTGGSGRGPAGGGDVQQMLSRAPAATAADLQKGDAVLVVTTEGSENSNPTAISLLAGVETILTASPDQSGQSLLTPWNIGAGGGEAGGGAVAAQ